MKPCVCLAMIGILFIGTAAIALGDDKPKVLFDEKFTSPLSAGWHWIREDSKSWKVENGKLLLRSVPGGPPGYVADENNGVRNILLRKAPVTSKGLILEVFVENQPELLYEHAALYLYYDPDKYIGVLKEWMGDEQMLRMIRKKSDSDRIFAGEKTYAAEGVWIRFVVKGDKATAYYRQTDKEDWRKMAQVDLPSKGELKVGFNAGGGPENAERWVRFSHFRILEQDE